MTDTNVNTLPRPQKLVPSTRANPFDFRLTRQQYRDFAEIAKAHGLVLELHDFSENRCWGKAGLSATSVAIDARDSHTMCQEYGYISLAKRINGRQMAADARPEIDIGAVPTNLFFDFVFWHEIGHKVWNFSAWDFQMMPQEDPRAQLKKKARLANEILADRFAWQKLFPGKSMPVRSTLSFAERRQYDLDIEALEGGMGPLKLTARKPLPVGQYLMIPTNMMKSNELAEWVGPECLVFRSNKARKERFFRGCDLRRRGQTDAEWDEPEIMEALLTTVPYSERHTPTIEQQAMIEARIAAAAEQLKVSTAQVVQSIRTFLHTRNTYDIYDYHVQDLCGFLGGKNKGAADIDEINNRNCAFGGIEVQA